MMEVAIVTIEVGTNQVLVVEAAMLIMVGDMTIMVTGKETTIIMIAPMVEVKEITGALAEEGDLQSTQPRNWR